MKTILQKFFDTENQRNYRKNSLNYAKIGLDSTMYLAYRDVPKLLKTHLFSKNDSDSMRLLDYGCGPGVSTNLIANFLSEAGKNVEIYGLDINEENLKLAKAKLPQGNFFLLSNDNPMLNIGKFDIVVCNFVLLENKFPTMLTILQKIRKLMSDTGVLIVTNCTPYVYDQNKKWYSFNNSFPENSEKLKNGQVVKLEISDKNTKAKFIVTDFFHSAGSYRLAYKTVGLELKETIEPKGLKEDGIIWNAEITHPPYQIHVISKNLTFDPNCRMNSKESEPSHLQFEL